MKKQDFLLSPDDASRPVYYLFLFSSMFLISIWKSVCSTNSHPPLGQKCRLYVRMKSKETELQMYLYSCMQCNFAQQNLITSVPQNQQRQTNPTVLELSWEADSHSAGQTIHCLLWDDRPTPWCWVFLEKLMATQLVKQFRALYETQMLITRSQEPTIYTKPDR
jgi:hypothetical protein